MKQCSIAMIGGDKRSAFMIPVFLKEGFRVFCYETPDADTDDKTADSAKKPAGVPQAHDQTEPYKTGTLIRASSLQEALRESNVIICGIPFSADGCCFCEGRAKIPLAELERCLRKGRHIFGGLIPDDFRSRCEERSIHCHDFMKEEELNFFLADATAEGAILEALLHKDTLLQDSYTLVLGSGRCARALAPRLKGLGADVTICARDPLALQEAATLGFGALPLSMLKEEICQYEYLFNTIPACCLNEECLSKTRADCLIIDLASARLGADYSCAARLKRNLRFCPGLPGKYAAAACGRRLAQFVLSHPALSRPESKQKGE